MPRQQTDRPSDDAPASPEAPRRAYAVPTVTELGRLSTLFKGGSGNGMDGMSGRNGKHMH
jgi:hypothetical protein